VVLGSASNGNVSLIVGVTKDLTSRVQAGKVIGPVAQRVAAKAEGVRIWPRPGEKMRLRWMPRWTGLRGGGGASGMTSSENSLDERLHFIKHKTMPSS